MSITDIDAVQQTDASHHITYPADAPGAVACNDAVTSIDTGDTPHGWGCRLCGIHETVPTLEDARRESFAHGMLTHDAFDPPEFRPDLATSEAREREATSRATARVSRATTRQAVRARTRAPSPRAGS